MSHTGPQLLNWAAGPGSAKLILKWGRKQSIRRNRRQVYELESEIVQVELVRRQSILNDGGCPEGTETGGFKILQ